MKKLLLALLSTLALSMVNAATLFDNGKTDWQIVIPVKADAAEKYAAAELQTALKKISGAEFPIVSSDEVKPRQIIIGSLATAPAVQKQINALKLKKSNTEMISVKTLDGALYLTGDVPRGALYAVYTFLQKQLGVRWFWPGEDGEFITRQSKYELPELDFTYTPSFRFREMTPCSMHYHIPSEKWLARNLMNGGSRTPKVRDNAGFYRLDGQHWVSIDRKLFPSKPELFSLINGKRVKEGYAGCWSNPEFFDYVVKKHLNIIKTRGFNMLNTFPADIVLRCECEKCTVIKDPSSRWYAFYAKLIEAIRKHYPETLFGGIAYQEYRAVPAAPVKYLEYVEYCQYNRCYVHKLSDKKCSINQQSMATLRKWQEKAPMGIYGYEFDVFKDAFYLPFWNMLAEEMKVFRDMKLVRMKTEFGINIRKNVPREKQKPLAQRLANYIYARLIWNADEKVEDILNDWCSTVYGKGGEAIKAYHIEMAKAWDAMPVHFSYFGASAGSAAKVMLNDKRIKFAREQFKKALAAVKTETDPELRKRHEKEIKFEEILFDRWEKEYHIAKENAVIVNLPLLKTDNEFDKLGRFNFKGKAASKAKPHPTWMKAYYTKDALHLQITAIEPEMSKLRKGKTGKDISPWNDDMIEMFLDLNNGTIFRQLCVNLNGGTYDAMGNDNKWNPNWQGKTVFEKDRWIMTIKLPFKSLGVTPRAGSQWKLVVIRNSKPAASGFPAPAHQDVGQGATFVFSGKPFTDRRLVWIATPKLQKGERFDAQQKYYLNNGWQFRKYLGAAGAEKADLTDAKMIVIETYQNKIPMDFYHNKLLPAVNDGAVAVFDSYHWIDKLSEQFKDPSFKVKFVENATRLRKPTWIAPDFDGKPSNLKKAIWNTPSGNFIPANPDKWVELARQSTKNGGEMPFIIARPVGKGMVAIIGDVREKISVLGNLLEYNKVIKRP